MDLQCPIKAVTINQSINQLWPASPLWPAAPKLLTPRSCPPQKQAAHVPGHGLLHPVLLEHLQGRGAQQAQHLFPHTYTLHHTLPHTHPPHPASHTLQHPATHTPTTPCPTHPPAPDADMPPPGPEPNLRDGVAEKNGVVRVFRVYWIPQLILRISQLFKT